MKEHLSIKKFSEFSGIETSTLRYWDGIGLFSPTMRDAENNYRYYSPAQLVSVNFIKVLSDLHISLKNINGIDRVRTPESLLNLIESHENQLDAELTKLHACYSILHTRRNLIKRGMNADPAQITVERLPEEQLVLGPPTHFVKNEGLYEPLVQFFQEAKKLRINLKYPIGGLHHSLENFLHAPGEPEHFFSLDPLGNETRKAGEYMVGYARGYYGQFGDLPDRMAAFAREKGLACHGPLYAIFLQDEICVEDPVQYLSQVFVAVKAL